jgi:hypothetical protein
MGQRGRRDESARCQDASLTSISPVRFVFFPLSPPPLPRVRTGHAHLSHSKHPSTRATQPEPRAGSDSAEAIHLTPPRLCSARPTFFFFLSSPLSLSPLQIAIPQSKHFPFSSPPRSSPPPPLQHATVVAAAAAAGKSPRALAAFRSGVAPPLSRRRVAPPAPSLWAVAWVCLGC